MRSVLDDVIVSCQRVSELSRHVKINYEKLDDIICSFDVTKLGHWLDNNPFGLLNLGSRDLVNFLLIYHTIGNYCFWGDPKWEIDTECGKLDGSYAMIYLILKRFDDFSNPDLTFNDFKDLLLGSVEVPLLQDRYDKLMIMNQFLKERSADFYSLIESIYDDRDLFAYIIQNLPYFYDESEYKGEKVYFYKRAQLLTSDLLHVREKLDGLKVNYHHLVGCADYKIPQVMRCYGILEFDQELSDLVDRKIAIASDSDMEIEIRANDIVVIDYIARKLEEKCARIDINDYIWLLGQDKVKMIKSYHRTMTDRY